MVVDEDLKHLIEAVIAAHPGPWKQRSGWGDRGGQFTSIVDAAGKQVFDGESGRLSHPVFDLLLNLPEMFSDGR